MTHSAPLIRRAETRDAAALAALFDEATHVPFASVAPHAGVTGWEKKLGEYADLANLPLIAVAGDAVVGVLLLRGYAGYIRRKHGATIDLLAVRAHEQRKGVGRALVNAALAACDGYLQVRRVDVNVHASGAALKAFYASFGFVEEGVKRAALFDGGYLDAAILARVNERVMPASGAPLPVAKRSCKQPPVKVTIRPASVDDAEAFARAFSDRSTSNGTLQHPYTATEIWRNRLAANVGTRQVVLAAKVNGRVIGNAGVHPVSDHPRVKHVCSVGIGIAHAYQGRGVGRALMTACIDFAERWANYGRIELTVHADNALAIKLYESLGFVHEGRLRDYSFREGGYVDALIMARVTDALVKS